MTTHDFSSLPKWQPILVQQSSLYSSFLVNVSHTKLIFGLTPPTMAILAFSIFLCILLEINTRCSSNQVNQKPVMRTDRVPIRMVKFWIQPKSLLWYNNSSSKYSKQLWFFTQLVELYNLIRSWVGKGVMDFKNEGKLI